MTRTFLAATAALALLVGCAHTPTSTAGPSPAAGPQAAGPSDAMMATCPMAVPGTEVSAADAAGGETMSPSHATAVDVENGSSILLTPSHAGDLQKLQAEVRMRAHRMRLNGCGTMEQARGS
jgi:hypothetical protein